MTVAIKFENVSKQYRLGQIGTGTLSHDLHRAWAKLLRKPDPFAKVGEQSPASIRNDSGSRWRAKDPIEDTATSSYVWALRDVDFEVEQGEVLGIIGRNGAGKSTLLKLLSRVTAPSAGFIKSRGRIASLLEVGTGFHPELTGRENVYLNGAILGMRRQEIAAQLDAIVDFSGCARYLDTPVKRYSSGMVVRLGFAVAAHLECEILIVDEVLAVGDAEFQRKCMGKMKEVSVGGRTVLFVSHNLGAMQALSSRVIWIKEGMLCRSGDCRAIIQEYVSEQSTLSFDRPSIRKDRTGNGVVQLQEVVYRNENGDRQTNCLTGAPLIIDLEVNVQQRCVCDIHFPIDDMQGNRIAHLSSGVSTVETMVLHPPAATLRFTLPRLSLLPGKYTSPCYITADGQVADWLQNAGSIEVLPGPFYATGKMPPFLQGFCLLDHSVKLVN
jgi:lipopolysaccharide transport system ATP-binding protein